MQCRFNGAVRQDGRPELVYKLKRSAAFMLPWTSRHFVNFEPAFR